MSRSQPSSLSVSFHPTEHIMQVLHIDDYSDEEREQCWYSADEINSIRCQNRLIVAAHKASASVSASDPLLPPRQLSDDEKFYKRGLEQDLPAANKRHQARRKSIHLVIQTHFFAACQEDEDDQSTGDLGTALNLKIAQLYKEASYECKMAAYLRGVEDAKVAKNVWNDKVSANCTLKERRCRSKQISLRTITSPVPSEAYHERKMRNEFFSLTA
ncbi:hypothetical protein IV203_016437 [Nitzschia inconspicua]|uniref:Uncharacterized protein n=1 Tax=Nitzschia inconspicua TaxID=303405 RepID=A0A9K3KPY9_9STRA|nr:hypothetical protein IV203_016437 [Nitzschia inconspicua]